MAKCARQNTYTFCQQRLSHFTPLPSPTMRAFAQALLLTPELWSSTCWQERTSLQRPPWEAPLEFMDGTPTMTEQVAEGIKSLVEAMVSPDVLLGSNGRVWSSEASTRRQNAVYYHKRFSDSRASWQMWVRRFLPTWKFLTDIDKWAATRGMDLDGLIILSQSREVSVLLLVSHRLD